LNFPMRRENLGIQFALQGSNPVSPGCRRGTGTQDNSTRISAEGNSLIIRQMSATEIWGLRVQIVNEFSVDPGLHALFSVGPLPRCAPARGSRIPLFSRFFHRLVLKTISAMAAHSDRLQGCFRPKFVNTQESCHG
jgi:hypothetical protein